MRWNDRLRAKAARIAQSASERVTTRIEERLRDSEPSLRLTRLGSTLVVRARRLRALMAQTPALRAILGGWA